MGFVDRHDAGRRLAAQLDNLREDHPVVIGLPRGGVVVADEVAHALDAPLDVIVVRKLGTPGQAELAMGAIAEDDVLVLNHSLVARLGINEEDLAAIVMREAAEVEARVKRFRHSEDPIPVKDRTVVLVDDGLATGATARAAARVLRARDAGRIVLAVPICSPDTADGLRGEVDEIACVEMSAAMIAVGSWYEDFRSITDDEVLDILARYQEDD